MGVRWMRMGCRGIEDDVRVPGAALSGGHSKRGSWLGVSGSEGPAEH